MNKISLMIVLLLSLAACVDGIQVEVETTYHVPANTYPDVLLDYDLSYVAICHMDGSVTVDDRYGQLTLISHNLSFDDELYFYQDVHVEAKEECKL